MRRYDPNQPLCYIHVPKTGGRSVRNVFAGWFGQGLVTHYFNDRLAKMHPVADMTHSPETPMCVYGHFSRKNGLGVEHSFPDITQFLTILRDPVERVVSQYYYQRRPGAVFRDPSRVPDISLREHLATTKSQMLQHFPRDVTPQNYRALIEEYFIDIGFLEDLENSLRRFAKHLGRDIPDQAQPRENAAARDSQTEDIEDLRAVFFDNNPLDHDVYQYAKARFGQADLSQLETGADVSPAGGA
ncbi:MAG: sulfotransferase family 2 domain-containing protein [Pelagimonas sp.]|uniref:sulfotransferase family 2 domain-containing protein n=1 Tax=Pelagimonas sp. TaxID=2073170 RepID=UPI003D6B104A